MSARIIVCAGGGGVGKTTTSAALSLALARNGARVLVVSLDPARRLGDALGVKLGTEPCELDIDAGRGSLFGLMPNPQTALTAFAKILFADDLSAIDRLRDNRVYAALDESVPGLHELVSVHLTLRAIEDLQIDTVVIDTAPSRNAIDFIGYPRRLAKLLGSRAVGWLAQLGSGTGPVSPRDKMGRVERLLVQAVGPAVRDAAGLFAELAKVRDRFVALNDQAGHLLLDPRTEYFLVSAPTSAARQDIHYLVKKLRALRLAASAVIINSAYALDHDWVDHLDRSEESTEAIRNALITLRQEQVSRLDAAERVSQSIAVQHPRLAQVQLPHIDAREPREIVSELAGFIHECPRLLVGELPARSAVPRATKAWTVSRVAHRRAARVRVPA